MTKNVLLHIEQVSKEIKQQMIVAPFSTSVLEGEVLALCGGNGAGKSTILRMIVGITQPTAGKITINQIEWKKEREAYANQLGYMPDDFNFGLSLTGREMLDFYAALRKVPVPRVDEVLELVGLADVQKKSVTTYSKGMRQRLLFAQAMLAKPRLLILDEPTNGLDPFWMKSFVEIINTLKTDGQTVIFSTHQLQVAEECADRAIFLNDGKIISEGSIADYKREYGLGGLNGVYSELIQ